MISFESCVGSLVSGKCIVHEKYDTFDALLQEILVLLTYAVSLKILSYISATKPYVQLFSTFSFHKNDKSHKVFFSFFPYLKKSKR